MRTKTILLGLLFCLTLSAQGVIDEVIWVVGDEAILRSEVEEERLRALYEGQRLRAGADHQLRFLPEDGL